LIVGVIKGGDELAALMQQLPVEVETKILRNGLAAGANVIRDEARARAPRKTGALARSVKTTRDTKRQTGQIIAKVRLKGRHAFLGKFFEYGVLPHKIWVSGGKESLVINGVAIGRQVWHPGIAPMPWFRPAFDAKSAAAVDVVGDYLRQYLTFGAISVPPVAVEEEAA
jgi:HK97 gp10 family phage protein